MVDGSAWTGYHPPHSLSLGPLDQNLYIYKHSLILHLDAEGADSMYIRNVDIFHIHKVQEKKGRIDANSEPPWNPKISNIVALQADENV
jgi:hypothetical protein